MTRHNDAGIEVRPAHPSGERVDQVRNGNRRRVAGIDPRQGRIAAQRLTDNARAVFETDYVREHITLGYAATVHAAQGITVGAHSEELPVDVRSARHSALSSEEEVTAPVWVHGVVGDLEGVAREGRTRRCEFCLVRTTARVMKERLALICRPAESVCRMPPGSHGGEGKWLVAFACDFTAELRLIGARG